MKKTSRKSWIRGDATWWCHFNITMTSRIDVRLACCWHAAVHFLSFRRAGTGMWDRIILHGKKQGKSRSDVREHFFFFSHFYVLYRDRKSAFLVHLCQSSQNLAQPSDSLNVLQTAVNQMEKDADMKFRQVVWLLAKKGLLYHSPCTQGSSIRYPAPPVCQMRL